MSDLKKQIEAARVKAIRELEKGGTDAYLPTIRWGFDLSALDRGNLAPTAKKRYRRELRALLNTAIDPLDFDAIWKYAAGLQPKRRSALKSALRLMISEYEQTVKAGGTPDNLKVVQAMVTRLEATQDVVKVQQNAKTYIKLTPFQMQEITALCGDDLEGKRDWIILGLLLGAGLLREELINLTFDALKQQPTKDGDMHDVLEVQGKGAKDRVIPISPLLADRLREWRNIVGGGLVARSLKRGKKLGASLSAWSVYQIVRKYGKMIDVPKLNVLDLRRTYAQLAYNAGISVIQIKELLGHSKLVTTQSYLDLASDPENTSGAFVPLSSD